MPLILDMPFDESPSSLLAQDYSVNEKHGVVKRDNVTFRPGKENNCISFSGGDGYLMISKPVPFINADHTMLFWYKSYPEGGINSLDFQYAITALLIERQNIVLESNIWYHIAITRESGVMKFYINGGYQSGLDITISGTIEQWAIFQGFFDGTEFRNYELPPTPEVPSPETYAFADVDSLKIYDHVLTVSEIIEEMVGSARQRVYWSVNGNDFIDNYGVYVESSIKLIENTERKDQFSHDWAEYHGEIVDTKLYRMKSREIELECWIKADGKMDFVTKLQSFLLQFQRRGLHRLRCGIHDYKPLLWDVYLQNGIEVEKAWRDHEMFGRFSISFVEPHPVKRAVRFVARVDRMMAQISLRFNGVVNVYWGDGASTYDVDCTDVASIRHTYTVLGVYEILVCCETEEITYWWTNGILIWNRL